MSTTPAVTDLATLARTYTAKAQPVPGVNSDAPEDAEPTEVEVRILTEVHDAVRERAAQQNQSVADVARAVLFQAAAGVKPEQVNAYNTRRATAVRDAVNSARAKALAAGLTEAEAQDLMQAAERTARNARPPLREYVGTDRRHRLRFTAPRRAYRDASDAIQASGRTIVSVVESGLRRYARTGNL